LVGEVFPLLHGVHIASILSLPRGLCCCASNDSPFFSKLVLFYFYTPTPCRPHNPFCNLYYPKTDSGLFSITPRFSPICLTGPQCFLSPPTLAPPSQPKFTLRESTVPHSTCCWKFSSPPPSNSVKFPAPLPPSRLRTRVFFLRFVSPYPQQPLF